MKLIDCLRVEDVEEQGAIQLFIEFLKRFDNPKLQSEAAWCCSAIAGGSSQDTKAVVDAGIIPVLSELLSKCKDVNVLQNTLDAISNIACDCIPFRDMCLNENILQQVIIIIEKYSGDKNTNILRSAASAISSLCGGNQQPLQVSNLSLPIIEKLLFHSDDDVVESACWAASYLSQGDNTRIQAILDHNMVSQLVKLLQHSKSRIQSPALKTVGNIVTGDDQQTQAVVDAGALPILRNLLKNKQFRQEAAWTISNITAGNSIQVKAVIDADIIPQLISILKSNCEWDVKKEAGWAIANAIEHASVENIKYLVKMKCVKPLCEILQCQDDQLVVAVLGGLKNILVSGQRLQTQGEKLFYARQIYEAGGVDSIIELKEKTKNKDINAILNTILLFYEIIDPDSEDPKPILNSYLNSIDQSWKSEEQVHGEDSQDLDNELSKSNINDENFEQNAQNSQYSSNDYSDEEGSITSIETFDEHDHSQILPKYKFVIRKSKNRKNFESEAERRFKLLKMQQEKLRQAPTKQTEKKAKNHSLAERVAKELQKRREENAVMQENNEESKLEPSNKNEKQSLLENNDNNEIKLKESTKSFDNTQNIEPEYIDKINSKKNLKISKNRNNVNEISSIQELENDIIDLFSKKNSTQENKNKYNGKDTRSRSEKNIKHDSNGRYHRSNQNEGKNLNNEKYSNHRNRIKSDNLKDSQSNSQKKKFKNYRDTKFSSKNSNIQKNQDQSTLEHDQQSLNVWKPQIVNPISNSSNQINKESEPSYQSNDSSIEKSASSNYQIDTNLIVLNNISNLQSTSTTPQWDQLSNNVSSQQYSQLNGKTASNSIPNHFIENNGFQGFPSSHLNDKFTQIDNGNPFWPQRSYVRMDNNPQSAYNFGMPFMQTNHSNTDEYLLSNNTNNPQLISGIYSLDRRNPNVALSSMVSRDISNPVHPFPISQNHHSAYPFNSINIQFNSKTPFIHSQLSTDHGQFPQMNHSEIYPKTNNFIPHNQQQLQSHLMSQPSIPFMQPQFNKINNTQPLPLNGESIQLKDSSSEDHLSKNNSTHFLYNNNYGWNT